MKSRGGIAAAAIVLLIAAGAIWLRRAAPTLPRDPDRPATGEQRFHGSFAQGVDAGEDIPVPLEPLTTLRGEVRDEVGGVAQVEVSAALRDRASHTDQPCLSSASTRSVAGGGFDLGPLCPGTHTLRAQRGRQVANQVVWVRRGPQPTPLVLELSEAMELVVRVENTTHQPIAGASVSIQDDASGVWLVKPTDEAGVARFSELVIRKHSIFASANGFLKKTLVGRVMAAGVNEVKVALTAGLMLEGRVIDSDGAPVQVRVRLTDPRQSKYGMPNTTDSAETDDDGSFLLGPAVPGDYLLMVTDAPWEPSEQKVTIPSPPLTLMLSKGATIEAEFLDEAGAPVREAELWFVFEGGRELHENLEPDDEGVLRIEGVRAGRHWLTGLVTEEPFGAAAMTFVVRRGETTHVTLKLVRGMTISGNCTSAPGTEEGSVPLYAADENVLRRLKWNGFDGNILTFGSGSVTQCKSGFEIKGLRAGRYALFCNPNSLDLPIWVQAGDVKVNVECAGRSAARLRFRAVDAQHRPVTDFGLTSSSIASHPGGFNDSELGSTPFALAVFAPGYATIERFVTPPANNKDLDLGTLVFTRGRSINGRVLERISRKPIEGATISFGLGATQAERLVRSGADGTFTLTSTSAEDSVLHVEHPTWLAVTVPVLASQQTLEVELSAAARIVGSVVTREGRDVRGKMASATSAQTARSAVVEKGSFELGPLTPGVYQVRLEADGFTPTQVEIKGPGDHPLVFVERLGGAGFAVELTDDQRRPIDATAALVPGAHARPGTQAAVIALLGKGALTGDPNDEGHIAFSSVPPAVYTLVVSPARDPSYVYAQVLTVSESMPSVLRVVLPLSALPP